MLDSVCERLPCAVVLGYGAAGTGKDKTIFARIDIGKQWMQKLCNIVPAVPLNHAFMLEYWNLHLKYYFFGPIPIQHRATGIFMALSNRNQSRDLFYVIPFNAVAFVLTAVLLANISYLFALIVLLCIDVSIHSPFSPFKPRTLKRESLKFIIWHQF